MRWSGVLVTMWLISGCVEDVHLTDGSTGLDGSLVPGAASCQSHVYACGNTLDDDEDGLVDAEDPDCVGPCDNNERGFDLAIPGGDSALCRLDCYFDQDQGSGNDGCEWDHRCDPLEPDPDPRCGYAGPPGSTVGCPVPQDASCDASCGPLVPNGCDCFGCCNLPAGSERFVFIGSVDASGEPSCSLDAAEDDARCHPCTPVPSCLNPCGDCELCLGRTELGPACAPDPDGGVPVVPDCGERQACGTPELPPCPDGHFCLTGCCTFFG